MFISLTIICSLLKKGYTLHAPLKEAALFEGCVSKNPISCKLPLLISARLIIPDSCRIVGLKESVSFYITIVINSSSRTIILSHRLRIV